MRLITFAAIAAAALCCAPASARDSTDRNCLTSKTRSTLAAAEAHFSRRFEIVSTCRPGAIIAGTSHPSEHAAGRAVDLKTPRRLKRAVVRWLYQHVAGVVMTYRNMTHIHFDTGHYHKLVLGADAYGGGHWPRRVRQAHLQR